ncbi:MAG: filamentous hemagglutinin N-terminal domain-containing protein, partial [Paracoccaceae bacterium]
QTHSVEVFQSSDRVSLLWDEFSIGTDKTVNFVQPSSRSIALNTVPNGNISHIHGALKANGRVFLINPSGIVFGSDAQVNVGGLLASTLHLGSQERFFSADESFLFKGESSASIINNGDLRALNARDDASVTFIAAQIENYGRIKARHVGLAAGSQVRLDLGAGFSIAVEKAVIDAKIEQGGAIQADGGRLILNAQTANDLLATVVNHDGISEATALTKDAAGDIYLVGNAGVRISENSQLSAAAKKPGRVTIKADHLTQAGKIDASASGAAQAGGEVLLDVSGRFNNSGVITANSANEDGGSISISAKNITETSRALYQADGFLSGGDITLTGSTEVFSSADFTAIGHQENGGRIDITAPDTRLLSNSITASGALKGGLVRLGGAFQGGKTPNTTESLRQSFVDRWGSLPDLSSAQSFFANDGVSIDVSSVKGQGGTAVAWSDQQTTFLGEIIAKGAQNGGSVEISSENNLRYVGLETIETGQGGHLLLDPKNITLGDAADASGWNYNGIIGVGYSGDKNLDTSGAFSNGDNAGRAVALNAAGDRMVIGAPFANGSENGGTVSNSGKVFLFSFSDNTFSGGALNATIGLNENFPVEGLSVSDNFGSSVAFNGAGDRLAVGALGDDSANVDEANTDAKAGAVYLFSFIDTDGAISNFVTEAVIGKGYSGGKNFSVDRLLGAVETPGSDLFGTSLALSDDATLLAIGASGDDGATIDGVDDPNATRGTGAVYLFKFSDQSFSNASLEGIIGKNYQDADNPLPQSLNVSSLAKHDAFGRSLTLNGAGNRLAVGAHNAEDVGGTQSSSGAVFLFSFSDNAFSGAALEATFGMGYSGGKNFDVSGLEAEDRFGTGVALNTAGDRLAVGAGFDDGSDNSIDASGAVYAFAFSDSDFNGATQIGTIGAGYSGDNDVNLSTLSDNDVRVAAKDQFGISVALNGAGDYLAVGASLNDGAENTSANSGAVYLFNYDAASLPDDAGE